MRHKSVPPLSPELEAILSAEREILPTDEPTRRRAQLRARTALWHTRRGSAPSGLFVPWFKRLSVAMAGLLITSASFGAWLALNRSAETAPAASSARPGPAAAAPVSEAVQQVESAAAEVEPQPPQKQLGSSERQVEASKLPVRDSRSVAAPEPKTSRTPSVAPHQAAPRQDELGLLDAVRRAVARNDFRGALRRIESHEQRFPQSQLSEERDALRVRALDGAGLDTQARRAASAFESRHPNSVLVPTLKDSERAGP